MALDLVLVLVLHELAQGTDLQRIRFVWVCLWRARRIHFGGLCIRLGLSLTHSPLDEALLSLLLDLLELSALLLSLLFG